MDVKAVMPERVAPPSRANLTELPGRLAHSALAVPMAGWAVLDAVIAISCVYAAHQLTPYQSVIRTQLYPIGYNMWLVGIVHAGTLVTSGIVLNLYERRNFNFLWRLFSICLLANFVAIGATTLVMSGVLLQNVGRYVAFYSFLLCACAGLLTRLLTRGFAARRKLRVLFLGDSGEMHLLQRELLRHFGRFYASSECLNLRRMSPLGRAAALHRVCEEYQPDEVVVDDDDENLRIVMENAHELVKRGASVRSHSLFHEELFREVPIDTVHGQTLLGDGWGTARHTTEMVKRSVDVFVSLVGLLIGMPVFVLVALAVKLTSRGPVFYTQTRVGRLGEPFQIYKFRTMRVDAEQDGAVWAQKNDDRATVVGRILRRTRLDEVPQFWNILKGDMSFVGPRPERPEFVHELEQKIPYYQMRHLVTPGLTGWAQIRYRYGASVEDSKRKLAFDLYYVRHFGIGLDLEICLRTLIAMARGAR